jgi:hypothetical protein
MAQSLINAKLCGKLRKLRHLSKAGVHDSLARGVKLQVKRDLHASDLYKLLYESSTNKNTRQINLELRQE